MGLNAVEKLQHVNEKELSPVASTSMGTTHAMNQKSQPMIIDGTNIWAVLD